MPRVPSAPSRTYRKTQLMACLLLALIQPGPVHGQARNEKLGQTGYQFLSVGVDARTGALGDAGVALPLGSTAMFFNPASMAFMPQRIDLALSRNEWIADISHQSLSIAISPFAGRWGVFGLSLQSTDYGEFLGTMVFPNESGYIDTGPFYPKALSVGLGYARQLTDRFSSGLQIKLASQYLGDGISLADTNLVLAKATTAAYAFDFGTYYRTPFRSLVFAMAVRNFSKEVVYLKESFQLPLTFTLAASMNLFDLMDAPIGQYLNLTVDASHPRSHPETVSFGLEYGLMKQFVLRSGYIANRDEYDISIGFGMALAGFDFDYSYAPWEHFDGVQRITLRFRQ